MIDVRTYTFTQGVGLVEDAETGANQPTEPAARARYVAGQIAAGNLAAELTAPDDAPASLRLRVDTSGAEPVVEVV